MSLIARRKSDDDDAPIPPVPPFLRQEPDSIEASIARLPHPRTSDPLNPAVAELMSKAILESGEAYIAAVVTEVEQGLAAYAEYHKQVQAWAEGERARVHSRAEDIATAHKEMQESREKFLALPRTTPAGEVQK
jgi:hypothetical protein